MKKRYNAKDICFKIVEVIKSCETKEQLENTYNWSNKLFRIHNLPSIWTNSIMKAYKDKKLQIDNGLAVKYSHL